MKTHYREKNKTVYTEIPVYDDGVFEIFEIKQNKESEYSEEYITSTGKEVYFQELSISDSLKFDSNSRGINLTMKIRIPQIKQITSLNVLKIGSDYHKVYNCYHFTNKNGFKQTDVTLVAYSNPVIKNGGGSNVNDE